MYTVKQEMDFLNVCAGVAIKMLEHYCSLEINYSGENPGVLEWFWNQEKAELGRAVLFRPCSAPCPFSGLFLICGLLMKLFSP